MGYRQISMSGKRRRNPPEGSGVCIKERHREGENTEKGPFSLGGEGPLSRGGKRKKGI